MELRLNFIAATQQQWRFQPPARRQPPTDLASLQHGKDHVKCRITNHLLPPGIATNITINARSPLMCPLADMVYAVLVGVGTKHGSHNYELALDLDAVCAMPPL